MTRRKLQPTMDAKERWTSTKEFKDCAREWTDEIGVKPARIQVQHMTRKWASCSPGGVVTFSADLLDEPRMFGEAVIVHELIHLKVPNHGPVFRSLVKAYLPHADQDIVAKALRGEFVRTSAGADGLSGGA